VTTDSDDDVLVARGADAPTAAETPGGGLRSLALHEVIARMGGARLCYGDPVETGRRTVIPVARVFTAGGFGYGAGSEPPQSTGEGGGGGGVLDARPIGYIELGDEGSCFHAIKDPDRPLRFLKVATAALTALLGTAAGRRAAGSARDRLSAVERPRLRQRREGRLRRRR
jgi:uncharacterized spore protein YtfJ